MMKLIQENVKHLFILILLLVSLLEQSCSNKAVAPALPAQESHLLLGNPSNAGENPAQENNYLLAKPQYVLSYNKARGTANWVSWHSGKNWRGAVKRQENFRPDNSLPNSWEKVTPGDYTNTGFDRGHLCPSDDRDSNEEDNAATFLMTNIIPQAPNNNRITWRNLEEYCRKLVDQGNELYIITGVYGKGGSGSNGGTTYIIAAGKITVPARLWKIILVLPEGQNDLRRIDATTRVIAVDMPNRQSVSSLPWEQYRISVDAIEIATGYDLFSSLSPGLQNQLESKVDTEPVY